MLNVLIEKVRSYFPSKDKTTIDGISIYDVCPKCDKDYNKCGCVCFEEDYVKAGLPW